MLGSKQKMIEKEDAAYLEKALAAWKDAQNYFDNVSDPDLIEDVYKRQTAISRRPKANLFLPCMRIWKRPILWCMKTWKNK